MKHFIYYSKSARTSGNFDKSNLMKAGRMDIACQIVIMSFFTSHNFRDDVTLHLIFDGGPDPPKHLELCPSKNSDSKNKKQITISKKDIAGLIKKLLYKYKKGEKREVAPGYFVEKKSLVKVIEELIDGGKKIYLLDKKGNDIREEENLDDCVFVLGDQDGFPKDIVKQLKRIDIEKLSIGKLRWLELGLL